jgi:hypothetical protein
MVKHDCESANSIDFLKKLFNSYKLTKELKASDPNFDLMQFSDSIVFSMQYSKERFPIFIKIISNFQYELFKQGLTCRGGVAYGKHFLNEGFLFSNGLIEAYKLEKNYAKYPRILVSNDLLELIYTEPETQCVPLLRENENEVFIDYFYNNDLNEIQEYLRYILENTPTNTPSLKEKLKWLKEYFDFKIVQNRSTVQKFGSPKFSSY